MFLEFTRCRAWARLTSSARSALAGAVHVGSPEDRKEVGLACEEIIGELDGAHPARLPGELLGGVGDEVDCVEEDLGGQAPRVEARVVLAIVEVVVIGDRAQLVGAAVADRAHELLQVVAALHEVGGELVEKGGVARRIGDAEVVLGVDQAAAEKCFQ